MLEFEGKEIPLAEGDTIAAALYRSGVKTFSRSFKYHRRRGLYCMTGDCPNCLVTVDGEPSMRACMCYAQAGQRVERQNAWPSTERDLLSATQALSRLLPVGFYYKAIYRWPWMWRVAEPMVRRVAGLGASTTPPSASQPHAVHRSVDVLVVGGGPAGLAAATTAAATRQSVVVVEENRLSARATAWRPLAEALERLDGSSVQIIDEAVAVGIYPSRIVPVVRDGSVELFRCGRVIVATGAVEAHPVFPGNDLPGIWLARGATRAIGEHGLSIGKRVAFWGETAEALEHLDVLIESGAEIVAVVGSVAREASVRTAQTGTSIVAARGRRQLSHVRITAPDGDRWVPCDALVMSVGKEPRDTLLRQEGADAVAAGEALSPDCSLAAALASGTTVGRGGSPSLPVRSARCAPVDGVVCLCEDVTVKDLRTAWEEGFKSTELLKRYSTVTMGPCQGAMCGPALRAFAAARTGRGLNEAPTTARPPARPVRLAEIAASAPPLLERRTSLHSEHLASGGELTWAGAWKRTKTYGDLDGEYWAVHRSAGLIDISTLGKCRVVGPDAQRLIDVMYTNRHAPEPQGVVRYGILVDERGSVFDDGIVIPLGPEEYYATFTSAGAAHAIAWLCQWRDRMGLRCHVIDETGARAALNLSGPRARDILAGLTGSSLGAEELPPLTARPLEVAGVDCLVIRTSYVGELSYELHCRWGSAPRLWEAICAESDSVRPFGLDAMDILRLERGHFIIGQDTDFDSTPYKLGMGGLVKLDKEFFVGQASLRRLAALTPGARLTALEFGAGEAPLEGMPLLSGERNVGYLTSSQYSPLLGRAIALGWVDPSAAEQGRLTAGAAVGHVVPTSFMDLPTVPATRA